MATQDEPTWSSKPALAVAENPVQNANASNASEQDESSVVIPAKKQSLSDLFTILCAGCALISDGYQNSLMVSIFSRPADCDCKLINI